MTLTGTDKDSGVLRTEYSLDNGLTVQIYTSPFTVSTSTTLQVKSIDKLGNEEVPQTITITINKPADYLASSDTTSSTSSNNSSATTTQTGASTSVAAATNQIANLFSNVLGVSTNGSISQQSNNGAIKQLNNPTTQQPNIPSAKVSTPAQQFSSLVKYTAVAIGILTAALILTFVGPSLSSGALSFLAKFF